MVVDPVARYSELSVLINLVGWIRIFNNIHISVNYRGNNLKKMRAFRVIMWTLLVGPFLASRALSQGSLLRFFVTPLTNLCPSDSDSDDPDDPPPPKPSKSSKRGRCKSNVEEG